jgi:hypothetical protein
MIRARGDNMAMSNAERQAKYREKMRAKGKKRHDEWIVEGGGIAAAERPGCWPFMTKDQLNGAIKKAVSEFTGDDEFLKEVIYAEIAAYAKKAAVRYKKYNEKSKALLHNYK